MDFEAFCRASRVTVVAGKGGVGKTTVAAALARAAAALGLDVLVIALEQTSALPALLGSREQLGYEEASFEHRDPGLDGAGATAGASLGDGRGRVRARVITPDEALLEYLDDHGFKRVSKRLVSSGAIDVVSTAIPGIKEILVLGKVKQLEREAVADMIILDAPAAGHAVSLLTSAHGLLDAARGGPVRDQAQDVVELLTDKARCQVLLVTLPEETPVNELVETAYRLEDEVGVALGPIFVNGCYPVLDLDLDGVDPAAIALSAGLEEVGAEELRALVEAAEFRMARQRLQAEQTERLREQLPLPQLRLPFLFTAEIGPGELEELSDALVAAVDLLPVGSDRGL